MSALIAAPIPKCRRGSCEEKAAPDLYFLNLHLPAVPHKDARTDCTPVTLGALQTNLDPVVVGRHVVA